ncbi:MAG: T9SS type A sorting domain-containing protein [Bacteroidia bacterium]
MNKVLISLFLFLSLKANAQNLVLNPSFEDTIACTGTYAMQCKYWYWATYGSPDYFSEQPDIFCGTSSVPQSGVGYQYARTGIAYVGLATLMQPSNPNYLNRREYIGGELSDTLKQGHEYCVSFYVSVAEELKYVTDGIGLYLSVDSAVDYTINTNLSFVPQISNPAGNIIYDTLNWVQISGTYIATGGEKYLTIGNFKDNANTMIDSINNSVPQSQYESYLFIDDVSVIDCTVGINEIENYQLQFFVSPNPVKNKLLIQLTKSNSEIRKLEIVNVLGEMVLSTNNFQLQNKIETDVGLLKSGVYFVKVFSDKGIAVKKFIKE